mmetsp:Transcript_97756/g.276526  ORF Transcript_97756/g.276526 Transcript_97756/m.276526 type:complete len:340 (-) Transcript_97756:83-1102(-)
MASLCHLVELGLPAVQRASPIVLRATRLAPTLEREAVATASIAKASPSASTSTSSPTKASPAAGTTKASPAKEAVAGAKDAEPTSRAMAPANALATDVAQRMADTSETRGTRPLWLEGTYRFKSEARLLSAAATDGKLRVVLDQTIFHPQGGGQPTDVGQITSEGLPPLNVGFVSMDKETGVVSHDCTCDAPDPWLAASQGTEVALAVDEGVRRANARIHSAGHLIDVAVASAGYKWVPGKGYHFPDGAYVEYVLTAEQKAAVDKDKALASINEALKSLLAAPSPVIVELRDGVRNVEIEKAACPCGGTHVENTSEIGNVTIKALKAKGTNMRVSYTMA